MSDSDHTDASDSEPDISDDDDSDSDMDDIPRDYAHFNKHYYEYERKVESMESGIARAESQLSELRRKYDAMMAKVNVYNGRKMLEAGHAAYNFSVAFGFKFNLVIKGLLKLKGNDVFEKGGFEIPIPVQLKYPKRIYLGIVEILDKFVWHRRIENKDGDHAIGRKVVAFTI